MRHAPWHAIALACGMAAPGLAQDNKEGAPPARPEVGVGRPGAGINQLGLGVGVDPKGYTKTEAMLRAVDAALAALDSPRPEEEGEGMDHGKLFDGFGAGARVKRSRRERERGALRCRARRGRMPRSHDGLRHFAPWPVDQSHRRPSGLLNRRLTGRPPPARSKHRAVRR